MLDEADRLRVDGLGPIEVGMSLRQAQAAAGQELVSVDTGGCTFAAPPGVADVRLLLQRGRVSRIDVGGASRVATLSGLRLGATVDQARALYGRRLVERDGDLLFTGADEQYALLLDVEAEQVVGLRAGLATVVGDDPCG